MGRRLIAIIGLVLYGCASNNEPACEEPPAASDSRAPMGEREAVGYAEELKSALTAAMKFADASVKSTVTVKGAVLNGEVLPPISFDLPVLSQGWVRHPGPSPAGTSPPTNPVNPECDPAWACGGAAFSFDVSRVNILWYKSGTVDPAGGTWTEEKLSPRCDLFEFRVHVMATNDLRAPGFVDAVVSKSHLATVTERIKVRPQK